MVYFKDSKTWLQQSTLLLEARPTTTRISTRYTLLPPTPTKTTTSSKPSTAPPRDPPSRALIVLKTYDPVSGTCLKYKTDKAAEVGRLVGGLGRCARVMAALPAKEERVGEEEAEEGGVGLKEGGGGGAGTGVGGKDVGKEAKGKAGAGGGGGGGGKKKKGKR